jgi:phosphoglycerate dehydrogenase-like enzyme
VTTVCVPSAAERDLLQPLPADVRVVVWDGGGDLPAGAEDVEFLVGRYPAAAYDADALKRMPRLQVLQLLSAGVERWLPIAPPGVTVCNGRGIHGASTAELAISGILALLRELPRWQQDQAAHRWAPERTDSLDGKRVLVLGAGDIGRRVAQLVEAFGATATPVARHARDGVRAMTDLPRLLGGHQVLVVALAHTPQTQHLVDARLLAALPDGAIVVNIARGPIIETEALLAELNARRLRAFLDVTDPEPLPADHPLWSAPNVLITPHIGGGTTGWRQRAYDLVRDQVQRYLDGRPLRNVVADGY